MKILTFLIVFVAIAIQAAFSQDSCKTILIEDDYSNSSLWTTQGNVSISGGVCSFNNIEGHSYQRAYQQLSRPVSDSYWKAEAKFEITATNPSGSGVGAIVVGLTAGNLDFTSNIAAGYTETNQDGIAAVVWSASEFDNDIDNWQFIIESKKGSTRTYTTTGIPLSSSNSTYYLSLERVGAAVQLSVFYDGAHLSQLPGSPITFNIDSSITGLDYVQQGGITAASDYRKLSAEIDSLKICDNLLLDTSCVSFLVQEDFSNAAGWTTQGNVSITNNVCFLNTITGRYYHRAYTEMSRAVSDSYWKVEVSLNILNQNPVNKGVGTVLIALTAGDLDFASYDYNAGLVETNQDGIAALLWSDSEYDNDMDNWQFIIEAKKGNARTYTPSGIYASSSQMEYFIVLERTATDEVRLRVFSDALHSAELVGSPITFSINSTITGLNYAQIGTMTPGALSRIITAEEDNLSICDNLPLSVFEVDGNQNTNLFVYPNPANESVSVLSENYLGECDFELYDIHGRLVYKSSIFIKENVPSVIDLPSLENGIYYTHILSSDKNTIMNSRLMIMK
ncbi:MAG: hypothetical protein CVU11_04330 [Bacteroidetes bacterium HGW-Bacteroidetes-6]|jgi:hypothetical protein|nr:MAG: hypothetical protein CVU11_04330 [Bacteroidetes bacterium HGW-Bacteroidetes-6]